MRGLRPLADALLVRKKVFRGKSRAHRGRTPPVYSTPSQTTIEEQRPKTRLRGVRYGVPGGELKIHLFIPQQMYEIAAPFAFMGSNGSDTIGNGNQ